MIAFVHFLHIILHILHIGRVTSSNVFQVALNCIMMQFSSCSKLHHDALAQ
jgi:hypothetical protein